MAAFDCQAIDSDWQSVQRDMLSALREKKEGIVLQKSDAQRRIARLKISESPRVIATREVKKSYPTSGWWVLCLFGGGWGWGKQSARETLDYRAAWFSRYEIRGGDYKRETRIDDPAKGVLNVDFTSTPGVNLDVTASFYRPEKDTEETAQQVASLERQVDGLTTQLEECETKICSFTCADSPATLAALIMTEKDALEHADRDLVEMLDRPATHPTDDFPKAPSQWSVITNFRGVLSVLVENQMLPADLAPSTREPIEAFLQAWDQVQKHLRELERGPGSSIITLKKSDLSNHQAEDAPPVKPSFRAMARASLETVCAASVVDRAGSGANTKGKREVG